MKMRFAKWINVPVLLVLLNTTSFAQEASATSDTTSSAAQSTQPIRKAVWVSEPGTDGKLTLVQTIQIVPKPEPKPALRYRFIDDPFDRKEWNAAIFYLRAFGFLEHDGNREALNAFWSKSVKEAEERKISISDVPPNVWQDMYPQDLPIEEVKEYLNLTSFQIRDLKDAQKCKSMSFDRHIEEIDSPATLLLPEATSFRHLARLQIVRCKLAIAENRIDGAIEVLRQQFAMAEHCGQDPILVTNLVGLAVAQLAADDCLRLIEHPDCPNLYWAFASLPKPLVPLINMMGMEKRFLLEEVKPLEEVNLQSRDDNFWNALIEKLASSLMDLQPDDWGMLDKFAANAKLLQMIEQSQTNAKQYLTASGIVDPKLLSSMSPNHVAMLALVTYYRERADGMAKWANIPYSQLRKNPAYLKFISEESKASQPIGDMTSIAYQFIATANIYASQAKSERQLALLQTIEAIRMYAAEHDGSLPESLEDTPYPVPLDPVTGQHFEYRHEAKQCEVHAPAEQGMIGFRVTLKMN